MFIPRNPISVIDVNIILNYLIYSPFIYFLMSSFKKLFVLNFSNKLTTSNSFDFLKKNFRNGKLILFHRKVMGQNKTNIFYFISDEWFNKTGKSTIGVYCHFFNFSFFFLVQPTRVKLSNELPKGNKKVSLYLYKFCFHLRLKSAQSQI